MKKIVSLLFLLSISSFLTAEETDALKIVQKAVSQSSPEKAAEYIEEQLKNVSDSSEKRALYAFQGSVYESVSKYEKACDCYVKAAGTAGGNISGFSKKSSEQLVIDAVRCALGAGEGTIALNYLNSSVRNSKNQEIQAYIKLYEQWAQLSNAEKYEETEEPVSMLKAYLNLDSMKYVKPSILFTLWYVTGDSVYGTQLKNEFPYSSEAGIASGKVQVMPSPFWYFVPHKKAQESVSVSENASSDTSSVSTESASDSAEEDEKALRHQLGLFRDKANADSFKNRLTEKGFKAYIQDEVRSSGTTYYIVVVDENKDGNMAELLKTAGFESCPIF